jgi:MoaA/NifB/PqqE/SkfB family radical SAM enzyme
MLAALLTGSDRRPNFTFRFNQLIGLVLKATSALLPNLRRHGVFGKPFVRHHRAIRRVDREGNDRCFALTTTLLRADSPIDERVALRRAFRTKQENAMETAVVDASALHPASRALANPSPRDRTRVHYRRFHNIYLYITEKCQLRCGHCYMGDRLARGQSMSVDDAKRTIRYSRSLGGEYITFLGGEPTLHKGLPDLVDYAVDQGYSQVMINSNGLLDKRIEKIAPHKLHYISFSVDGATAKTHNTVRGEGTYEKTIPCVRKTVEQGYAVRLICTISQVNIHEAEALLNLADEIGISMVNFHVFSEEGLGIGKDHWSLTPQEWIDFYTRLEAIKHQYRTSIWYPPTYATIDKLQGQYVKEGYKGCVGCSLDRLSIFPDGRSYVCSVLFDRPVNFGMMTSDGLKVNPGATNEFNMFATAMFNSKEPYLSGCPAETVLEQQGKKQKPENLISMCRLWKSQA